VTDEKKVFVVELEFFTKISKSINNNLASPLLRHIINDTTQTFLVISEMISVKIQPRFL